ncbi:cupin domain-containing protein [Candidatus Hydrogenedentota bacterium]
MSKSMLEKGIDVYKADEPLASFKTSTGTDARLFMMNKNYATGFIAVQPHSCVGNPAAHCGDEIYLITQGKLYVWLPDCHVIHFVNTGEAIAIPKGVMHAGYNDGRKGVLIFDVSAPCDASKNIKYTLNMPEIMQDKQKNMGQLRVDKTRIFPVADTIKGWKGSKKYREKIFWRNGNIAVGAFSIPSKKTAPRPFVHKYWSSMYVLSGSLTAETDEKKVKVGKAKTLVISPGTSVTLSNTGVSDVGVYFGSSMSPQKGSLAV